MPQIRTQLVTLLAFGLSAADVAAAEPRVNTGEAARVLPLPTQAEVDRAADAVRLPKDLKVPAEWVPYLNRAYEEYWTEGTHRPDAGFVLFARNPTKETAKLWLLRMESKAQNLEQLFVLVKDAQIDLVRSGLMSDRFNMVTPAKAASLPTAKDARTLSTAADLSSLEFFFIFSPSCPHCAHMAENLVGFPNVRPLQATKGPVKDWPGLPPSDRATPETLNTYIAGGGVPVLVVFDRKSNRLLKMTGAKSQSEILGAASSVLASTAPPTAAKATGAGENK